MAKLHMDDIAEGGVLGAKQYFPGFDISGSVLLDLSVQGHTKAVELHFMRRLNAVLIETDDLLEKPAVAVHFLGGRAIAHSIAGATMFGLIRSNARPTSMSFSSALKSTRCGVPRSADAAVGSTTGTTDMVVPIAPGAVLKKVADALPEACVARRS